MTGYPEKAKSGPPSELLDLPPKSKLGPAMKKLPERQQAFVIALLQTGGRNYSEAYRLAGYAGNQNSIKAHAWRMAHDEDILAAMREEAEKRMQSGSILAVETVRYIMDDVTADRKDRLKAAEMILNRIGMHATTEHKMSVTHKSETNEEMIERIKKLSGQLGIDPGKLLGSAWIEAEFEEVKADPDDISDLL